MLFSDLTFSDLFVASSVDGSWYKSTPDSKETHLIPNDCKKDVEDLRAYLDTKIGNSDFRIKWPLADGIRMRVKRQLIADDQIIYVCRRYRLEPGPLEGLGMPKAVSNKLMSSELENGLVIFLGKTGSGKTTTAGSFTIERLKQWGGVAWTIENPIELEIQGRHGKGVLYQTEVENDDDIADAIKGLYRATPNMIYIGEVRTAASVKEAITAAAGGQLVVITFHANDLTTGLARFARLAGEDDASSALADVLRVAIHLHLYTRDDSKPLPGSAFTASNPQGTGTPPRILSVEPLWVTTDKSKEAIKSIIRNSEFQMLSSEIGRQKNEFLSAGKLPGSRGND